MWVCYGLELRADVFEELKQRIHNLLPASPLAAHLTRSIVAVNTGCLVAMTSKKSVDLKQLEVVIKLSLPWLEFGFKGVLLYRPVVAGAMITESMREAQEGKH